MEISENSGNKSKAGRKGWLGKIKLIYLLAAWLIITVGIVLMLFRASRTMDSALSNQRELTEKTMRCVRLAEQMQSGSDILTEAVWRFVATGREHYAEVYLTEMEETRSRDKAIEKLRQEDMPVEVLKLMENAKESSDALMEKELKCMRLVYEAEGLTELPETIAGAELTPAQEKASAEDKRKMALQYVFGDEYAREKEQITGEIRLFTSTLNEAQNTELSQAMKRTDEAQSFQHVIGVLLLAWMLGFWMMFYWQIVRPIHFCLKELTEMADKEQELKLRGTYELQSLIAAFNKSIKYIQDKNKEISDIQMIDPVTGGYTAIRFDLEAAGYLQECRGFSFVSMDIRRFKLINDVLGSEEGDVVLKAVYDAVQKCLKSGEIVSRIQSDIFNVILCETDKEAVENRIAQISKEVDSVYGKQENPYHLSLNCGVYQVQCGERDITTIRDRANVARGISKSESGYISGCVFYTELERQRLLKEQVMENEMEHALEAEEFLVFLQPKVRLRDGAVVGAEALVRWKSSTFGMIPPDEFIPLFEKNGFIRKLDCYMFRQVCRLLRRWIDSGEKVVPVSVNLSRNHIRDEKFIGVFKQIQEEYKIPSEYIELELTEAMVFEDLPKLKELISKLHEAGYHCAMDDFGSGYSSLNVLKEIPVDVLKLDRAFFVGGDSERGMNVVRAVLQMAKELKMSTVAEGIETSAFVNMLREQGCDMVQGYVFYKPMPAEMFERLILKDKDR